MAGLPCTPAHAARLSLQSSHRRYHEHVCCTLQCMALVSRQPHIAHVRTACRRGHGDRSATGPLRSCGALHQRPSPQPHSHTSMSGGAATVPAGPPPGAAQLEAAACPCLRAKPTSAACHCGTFEGPARPWPMAHATTRPAAPPSASATGLSAAPRWERLRDHGHGRRPSPTQTAPRGGRSRDYLVGGGRSASHVPYPDLAGRHRGQAAIGATGVTGAALNSLFYRSRVQPRTVTAEASYSCIEWPTQAYTGST